MYPVIAHSTREALNTWRGYAKLMKSKKQLRDLEKQKEKSAAKIGQFLLNLKVLKRQLAHTMDGSGQHVVNKAKPVANGNKPINHDRLPELESLPSSVDRYLLCRAWSFKLTIN